MSDEVPVVLTVERHTAPSTINILTWRYLGERTAADLAYCARFGVAFAPEPTERSGVLSYAVPNDVPRR